MTDTALESEVRYLTNSDEEKKHSHNGTDSQGQESSNDSIIGEDQVEESMMKVEGKEEKEAEKEKEENEQEEKLEENGEPCGNEDRLNNEAVTDIEDEQDLIKTSNNDNDENKDNEDSMEMDPPGWEKAYEIRIDLLREEINETEKKHELWQDRINSRKEEALKRWEMIKKKNQDHLKAQHRIHAVMDSVLNKDNEETIKEEFSDI